MAAGFLSGVEALLVEPGLGKVRKKVLATQLEKNGGRAVDALSSAEDSSSLTHILVGNKVKLARLPFLLKVEALPSLATVLRADWLTACLTKRRLVPEEGYAVLPEKKVASW